MGSRRERISQGNKTTHGKQLGQKTLPQPPSRSQLLIQVAGTQINCKLPVTSKKIGWIRTVYFLKITQLCPKIALPTHRGSWSQKCLYDLQREIGFMGYFLAYSAREGSLSPVQMPGRRVKKSKDTWIIGPIDLAESAMSQNWPLWLPAHCKNTKKNVKWL